MRPSSGRTDRAADAPAGNGPSAALVLADRTEIIGRTLRQAYPVTRTSRVTYSGTGYGSGYAQGQRADIGTSRLGRTIRPSPHQMRPEPQPTAPGRPTPGQQRRGPVTKERGR